MPEMLSKILSPEYTFNCNLMSEYVNADSCMYACFCMWVFVNIFCSTKALNLHYALYTFLT